MGRRPFLRVEMGVRTFLLGENGGLWHFQVEEGEYTIFTVKKSIFWISLERKIGGGVGQEFLTGKKWRKTYFDPKIKRLLFYEACLMTE